jgi:hypothetical protein
VRTWTRTERQHRTRRYALPLAALLAAGACATTGTADPFTAPHADPGIVVVVENHAWTDMSVYAASGAGRVRLGSVTSGRTETFRVHSLDEHVVDMELFADPLASSTVYRSGRLVVLEGQQVIWTIHESDLGGSVTVR